MLKLIITIFLSIGACGKIFAKEIIIKINGEECTNCTKIISYMQQHSGNSDSRITCVFRELYKQDSSKYSNKFLISKFEKVQVIFSDSLYEYYNLAVGSEIIIISSKNVILFRNDFRSFNPKLYLFVCNSQENEDGEILIRIPDKFKRELMYIYGNKGYKLSFAFEEKDYIYDIISGQIVEVQLNEVDIKTAYEKCFGDSASHNLEVMSYLSKIGAGNFEPQTVYSIVKNDSVCESILSLPKFKVQGKDTTIDSEYFLMRYNIIRQEAIKFESFPKFYSRDYFILPIMFSYSDKSYFFIRKRTIKESDTLYNLIEADKNFKFAKIYSSMLLPTNYVKNKIYYNCMQPKIRSGILSNIFSNELHSFESNLSIKIPIHDSLFEGIKYILNRPNRGHNIPEHKLKYVSIYDAVYTSGNFYRVLYGYKSKVHILDFDNSGVLMDKELNSSPFAFQTAASPIFIDNEHYVLMSKKEGSGFFLKYVD